MEESEPANPTAGMELPQPHKGRGEGAAASNRLPGFPGAPFGKTKTKRRTARHIEPRISGSFFSLPLFLCFAPTRQCCAGPDSGIAQSSALSPKFVLVCPHPALSYVQKRCPQPGCETCTVTLAKGFAGKERSGMQPCLVLGICSVDLRKIPGMRGRSCRGAEDGRTPGAPRWQRLIPPIAPDVELLRLNEVPNI